MGGAGAVDRPLARRTAAADPHPRRAARPVATAPAPRTPARPGGGVRPSQNPIDMTRERLRWRLGGLGLALALLLGACMTTQEANQARRERQERATARARSEMLVQLSLAAPDTSVRTIQLYGVDPATGMPSETALPVYRARSAPLVLEFDVLRSNGRPLSVYFYHADRRWRRDLSPGEYLTGFQRDDLLNYTLSRGTQVPYVHYTYRFPNDRIQFEISGNYILRVTEQGNEDAVLFEHPFFVAEQAMPVDLTLESVMVGGQGSPSVQPAVFFRPPEALQGQVFDFSTCFVRNGRYEWARCTDQPSLTQQPLLHFYLQPETAFEPLAAEYYVDLGALRVGSRIARTDLSTSPFRILLEPDYARFSADAFAPRLNGQPVVSAAVRSVNDPDVAAEYVSVRFAYVPPDDRPFDAEVILTGSFNRWRIDPANRLRWVPDEQRYVVDVLLKQGAYEYAYFSRDARLRRELRSNLPRTDNLYTAFVYYRDLLRNTDRLLAVEQVVSY
ncbi:MAG: DUF5103 domain-containing protein [Bacteroidetes bacterium]|nr:MAG: DUF5103 domain-containing protein [Bacteroidota bacterium]